MNIDSKINRNAGNLETNFSKSVENFKTQTRNEKHNQFIFDSRRTHGFNMDNVCECLVMSHYRSGDIYYKTI